MIQLRRPGRLFSIPVVSALAWCVPTIILAVHFARHASSSSAGAGGHSASGSATQFAAFGTTHWCRRSRFLRANMLCLTLAMSATALCHSRPRGCSCLLKSHLKSCPLLGAAAYVKEHPIWSCAVFKYSPNINATASNASNSKYTMDCAPLSKRKPLGLSCRRLSCTKSFETAGNLRFVRRDRQSMIQLPECQESKFDTTYDAPADVFLFHSSARLHGVCQR